MPRLDRLPTIDLTAELRRRGFAVCVFTWEDALEQHGYDRDSAKAWMAGHRRTLEEAMCRAGNEYIDSERRENREEP